MAAGDNGSMNDVVILFDILGYLIGSRLIGLSQDSRIGQISEHVVDVRDRAQHDPRKPFYRLFESSF